MWDGLTCCSFYNKDIREAISIANKLKKQNKLIIYKSTKLVSRESLQNFSFLEVFLYQSSLTVLVVFVHGKLR